MEQERPNIFTNSVANIGPGETVVVQIEYQEPVHQSGDELSLRVPLVVAPRYNPAPVVQTVDFRPTAAAGARSHRPGTGSRPHLAAGARSAQSRSGQSGRHHGAAQCRLPAGRGQERAPAMTVKIETAPETPRRSGSPTRWCRPTAISS